MQSGKVLVAEHDGTFIIKLVGDVRLTLCTTIDEFYDRMFTAPDFMGVLVDLREAEGIDSTSLGLLAKLSIRAKREYQLVPPIISTNPDITRLLESMGFDKVFTILREYLQQDEGLNELPLIEASEESVRGKVVEAHQVLMGLNEKNRTEFTELVTALEIGR